MNDDWNVRNLDQRTHLLRDHDRLNDMTGRLDNTRRVAYETEAIGVNILTDLDQQGQTLQGARDRVGDIDESLTRGRRILRAMSRRVITNKLILMFIVLLLLGANFFVIYFKWLRHYIG